MLDQRLRRWTNIVQMLYKCFVFTGVAPSTHSAGVSFRMIEHFQNSPDSFQVYGNSIWASGVSHRGAQCQPLISACCWKVINYNLQIQMLIFYCYKANSLTLKYEILLILFIVRRHNCTHHTHKSFTPPTCQEECIHNSSRFIKYVSVVFKLPFRIYESC